MGMEGGKVWDAYREGKLSSIRDYCETDALNTYLVYLRFQHIRGLLDEAELGAEYDRVRRVLRESGQGHLAAFLAAWDETAPGD